VRVPSQAPMPRCLFLRASFSFLLAAICAACGGSYNSTTSPPANNISVAVTPQRGALAVSQTLKISATVANDVYGAGVTWSASAGAFSGQTTTSATYTAPASASTAGPYTITATSVADSTKSASISVAVTDLTAVSTYHNDLARDGANTQEYALTPSTVKSSTFGKLFSCAVDGAVYAQPLWFANLNVGGTNHNVIFVATQHESVYAFDADINPCVTLWHFSLIDPAHGGTTGEGAVPSGATGNLVGQGFGDITSEVGITGTPVIDASSSTLFAVSKSVIAGTNPIFFQRLHALDLATGNEKFGGPVFVSASVSGTGDGATTIVFNPQTENQRPGLALANGNVYISWAAHEDVTPYHGWVIAYSAATLAQVAAFATTPNGGLGGIWMGGAAPAVDSSGNIFLATGNGTFDSTNDYGDSIVKLGSPASGGFPALDFFTPSNQASLNSMDGDVGSGGVLLLPDVLTAPQHLLAQVGKEGKIYLVNRDSMGGYCNGCADKIVEEIPSAINGMWGMPAFWNGTIYTGGAVDGGPGDNMKAFAFNTGGSGLISVTPSSMTPQVFNFAGPTPSVSSSGATNGIVWALDNSKYGPPSVFGSGPTVLHAYDATNLANELWNSAQSAADQAGNAVKFTVPTVANGKVYVGTRTEISVYGLRPN
jgi:hypothetical protein